MSSTTPETTSQELHDGREDADQEEQVQCQGQDDQESSSDVLNGHQMGSGVLSRNNIASRSQVSSPKTTDPLAPKLVNWS
jgi:hypothetical protein